LPDLTRMPSQQSVSIARLYSRPLIRVADYLAFLEQHTYDGRSRVRSTSSKLSRRPRKVRQCYSPMRRRRKLERVAKRAGGARQAGCRSPLVPLPPARSALSAYFYLTRTRMKLPAWPAAEPRAMHRVLSAGHVPPNGLPGLERAPFPGGERALRARKSQLTLVVSE
jgi:hypothetical protein